MEGRFTLFLCLSVLCLWVQGQEDECYTVQTDVRELEQELAAAVCAVNDAINTKPNIDYETAKDVYENGRGDDKLTLKSIATADYPTLMYQKYAVFFGDDTWMDTLISDAFDQKQPFNTDTKRSQMIKKMLQSSVLVQQMFHHLDSAKLKAESGNLASALKSWDKAMSVYYGADVDCSPFGNGQARGIEFGLMSDGISMTNSAVHSAFLEGAEALQGTLSSQTIKTITDARLDVIKQITIIYIQAAFKYATLIVADDEIEKSQAEGFAYYHAIVPIIADVDPQGAQDVLEAFNVANEPDKDKAAKVKDILRSNFESLGIDESEVMDFDDSRKGDYVVPDVTSCRLMNQFSEEDGETVISDR